MSIFDDYINRILKWTFLSRREQQAWKEEMLGHLQEATAAAIESGANVEDAQQAVKTRFGTVSEVRSRIIHETFGVEPFWFILGAVVSFLAFVFSLFINMRVGAVIPNGLIPIPTPTWVSFAKHFIPVSPAMWVGLSVMCLMFIHARSRRDRLSVFVSMLPFFAVFLVDRIPFEWSLPRRLFYSPLFGTSGPLTATASTGYILLFGICLAAYAWTRNRKVSLVAWWVSIALTLWPLFRDTVQTALWKSTNNPIFWGHFYPDGFTLGSVAFSILARLLILALILYGCRKIDLMSTKKINLA